MEKKKILVILDRETGEMIHITKGYKGKECMSIKSIFDELAEEELDTTTTKEYNDNFEQDESVLA